MRCALSIAIHREEEFHLGIVVALVAKVYYEWFFCRHVAICIERIAEINIGILDAHKWMLHSIDLKVKRNAIAGVAPAAK